MSAFKIGCIADDFTGAGDAASFLAAGGMKTLMLIWPHVEAAVTDGYDAVVVALKSRSIAPELAVAESLAAVNWLLERGAEGIYFKYCSTFDSTPRGNIGPVCDAILERGGLSFSLLCPSLLSNGRSVRAGELFVNGVPLTESHMRAHPLNPMWSSKVAELMGAQSKYPSYIITAAEYAEPARLNDKIKRLERSNAHFYLIPDYYEPQHGEIIARLFGTLPFLSGGSGLLGDISSSLGYGHAELSVDCAGTSDRGRLMLAGSCSDMTRRQVARWKADGGRAVMVSADDARRGAGRAKELAQIYIDSLGSDILYYSSGSADAADVDTSDKGVSAAMESLLSSIATEIFSVCPPTRLISAGGETSGAIITALGFTSFAIGDSVAPGVPILKPSGAGDLRLVLKSRNFGAEDFFLKVLA